MRDQTVLTVAEVARRLRVDPRTAYRMIEAGQLRAVKAGRLWRVPVDALEEYLRGQSSKEQEGGEGH